MAESRALAYLRQHRAHDVRALLRCWRLAVKGTGFRLRTLGQKDDYPLVCLSNLIRADVPGFYVSAGIHGDEPAPPWGLLDWFERRGYEPLGQRPILLFPCLNPLGLVENRRVDGEGRDLNRLFHHHHLTPIREVRQEVSGHRFQLALCLHEDYDARGAYIYDLNRAGDAHSARQLLRRAVTANIPVDSRSRLDGRRATDGVVFRRPRALRNLSGLPEAVFLFLEGYADRTFTFETPSEFSLPHRVDAQRRFLDAACRWCAANA